MGEPGRLWAGDREISEADIACIQTCMRRYGSLPRTGLIHTVCVYMDWLTPAGETKFTACKKLLERLEARGEVVLPARDPRGSAPRVMRSPPGMVVEAREAVTGRLGDLSPVRLEWLDGDPEVERCHAYLERFHPLGYRKPFGYCARYRIASGAHDLGYLLFAGPARAIATRDRWIGWSAPQRRMNLPWVVNNQRFLIFPWVSVKDLASHVLGQVAARLADDWQARWGYTPLLLETFVDPAHYRGTCYRAAGWECLGETSGRGLARPGRQYKSSPKLVFVKPLNPEFRTRLCAKRLQDRPPS